MSGIQPWIIVLLVLVMGWFAIGIIWNLRRGNAVLKWMQTGLPSIGEKTTLRWMGSSAVQLDIAKAKAPFKRFQLILVMEPRDVPWLWLFYRARGRRDMLILRGQLNSNPRLEYELVEPDSWTGKGALAEAVQARWGSAAIGAHRFLAPQASLGVSDQNGPALLETAQKIHPTLWRLAVRREYPQFELHIPLPDPNTRDSHQFFQAVRDLAQQTSAN